MLRAHAVSSAREGTPAGRVVLAADERHLRRKLLTLEDGRSVMVDLPETVMLGDGDRLVLEDGHTIEVSAAAEALIEAIARDQVHLVTLAWHLGNRHLPAQVEAQRILVGRDHVIRDMLVGLGATARDVIEPFQPVRGAYHGHSHGHSHAASGTHHHRHDGHGHTHSHTSHEHGHTVTHSHSHSHDGGHRQTSHTRVSVKTGPDPDGKG